MNPDLEREKRRLDALLAELAAGTEPPDEELIRRLYDRPRERLAVYGSLRPGESNAGVLDGIEGTWENGSVEGDLIQLGWGASIGYPGLTWTPGSGTLVPVEVLESRELPAHLERIDAFEGEQYRRILVPVLFEQRVLAAQIYALQDDRPGAEL